MHPETNYRALMESLLAILVLIGVGVYLFMSGYFSDGGVIKNQEETNVSAQSLGDSLYSKSNNPIENKLPEQQTIGSPIDDAYKNPFK